MIIKNHFIMILIAFAGWLIFYLIGLPSNYYLDWSNAEKILLLFIGFFAIFPFITFMVIILLDGDYFLLSIWLAFYASVSAFILDLILVGFIQGKGFGFLLSHWVLTIGYIETIIIVPLIGYTLKKFKKKA